LGGLAAAVAVTFNFVETREFMFDHILLLFSSSVSAAGVAAFLLSLVMSAVVVLSHRAGINPDNVASPIAGMLGDTCTLGLIALFAHCFWVSREEFWFLQVLSLAIGFVLMVPACAMKAFRSQHTNAVLREGWTPVVVSMFISSEGGVILKHAVQSFRALAAFAPVMNGSGGNLAAVQASRLSTDLHSRSQEDVVRSHGEVDEESADDSMLSGSCGGLGGPGRHERTARELCVLVLPASLCFATLIEWLQSGREQLPSATFLLAYEAAAFLQVIVLMIASNSVVKELLN